MLKFKKNKKLKKKSSMYSHIKGIVLQNNNIFINVCGYKVMNENVLIKKNDREFLKQRFIWKYVLRNY